MNHAHTIFIICKTIALFAILNFFFSCNPASEKSYKPQTASGSTEKLAPPYSQLIVVRTADWSAVEGKLTRFDYKNDTWEKVGESIPVVVGKNGLGWGIGAFMKELSGERNGPVKVEGDLKSPAGIFSFGKAFGYASFDQVRDINFPYTELSEYTQCIEDIHSKYYNQIVDDTLEGADWSSSDHMLRKDDLYEWGIELTHNYEKPEPGSGSCIFLHVWRRQGSGTAGCTAMEKENMKEILEWLDPDSSPIIVQLPEDEYVQNRLALDLPDF